VPTFCRRFKQIFVYSETFFVYFETLLTILKPLFAVFPFNVFECLQQRVERIELISGYPELSQPIRLIRIVSR